MTDFNITFVYPWVLLLLVPAIGLALWSYFRTPKKYRRNRNRITSLVLHISVMVLSIFALSGVSFAYNVVNDDTELILLVDASFSNEQSEAQKDDFVRQAIKSSASTNKVGVVTFGYDQVYAAPLTNDVDEVYSRYKAAKKPNTTASDISSAVKYASSLFDHPKTAKIVLISDGLETDGDVVTDTISGVAAAGIRIDTVYLSNNYGDPEVQITDIELPDYNIAVDDEFEMTVYMRSRLTGNVTVNVYDNDEDFFAKQIAVGYGEQSFTVKHSFADRGLHELRCEVVCSSDTLAQNNVYTSYYYIETFKDVLIVAYDVDDAENFRALLTEDETYTAVVADVHDPNQMPSSLDELRLFDEVVLFNISNPDMPLGFIEMLNQYVSELGGGLFTVGGDRVDTATGELVANGYNRNDMYLNGKPTLYQEMLPVQVIDYTPPIGVMIVVDCSGSMNAILEDAKAGAIASLYSLTDRDYCGIMSLSDEYKTEQSLLPLTQQNALIEAINGIGSGGGTKFAPSIEYAGRALASLSAVERRHIILVTDGQPGDGHDAYMSIINDNYEKHGITFSLVIVGSPTNEANMREAVQAGHGNYYDVVQSNISISDAMRQDLSMDEIKEYNPKPFTPTIRTYNSIVNGIKNDNIPELGGFYGTKAKISKGVETILTGEYAPIYVQWDYGKGKVGSFMSELTGRAGSWSEKWMSDETGKKFLFNVVNALFPWQSIKYSDLDVEIEDDNYRTDVNIYTTLNENEAIELTVIGPATADGEASQEYKIRRTKEEGYSRLTFENPISGVYEVHVKKLGENDVVISEFRTFRAFSYSGEYNMFVDQDVAEELMKTVADKGNGSVITSPYEVFEDFVEIIHDGFNPRMLFIILILVMFLLDIAVRKFKWKWIHELVRERKAKKQGNND